MRLRHARERAMEQQSRRREKDRKTQDAVRPRALLVVLLARCP